MNNPYINDSEVLKALSLIVEPGEIFELRILNNNKKTDIRSGYFKDPDVALEELKKQNLQGCNVYIVLNSINDACSARQQFGKFLQGCTTTSDNDIVGRNWLPIDIDPVRPAGTSSSEAELKEAYAVMEKVFKYLESMGFNRPIMATSGNGWHLLYKIALANTNENKELVGNVLKTLNAYFGNDKAKVDKANSNAARVFKLYGTAAQKGNSTEDRPHRMSQIQWTPQEVMVNDKALLEKVARSMAAEPEKKSYNNHDPKHFDLGAWLDKYEIEYEVEECKDYTKFILPVCPFNDQHTGKDACLFQLNNGAISFHCFHDSCADHTWQELRQMYEPDAYEQRQKYTEKKTYQTYNRDRAQMRDMLPEPGELKFEKYSDIRKKTKEPAHYILSGIKEFDRQYGGFRKKTVTALSGYTGGAKSTLLSQIVLNCINQGAKVAVFSGEMDDQDYCTWMTLQAAGKTHVEKVEFDNGREVYEPKEGVPEKIEEWLDDKFFLYNNRYGFSYTDIINSIKHLIQTEKLDMVFLMQGWRTSVLMYDGQAAMELAIGTYGFCNPRESLYDAFVKWEGADGYRLSKTMMNYDQLTAYGVAVQPGAAVYGNEGFFFWKNQSLKSDVITDMSYFQGGQFINLKMMRYAEVLLLAAEANLQAGNSAKALQYINEIRTRAKETPLTAVTLNDIKTEKRLELCNEGVRYQDLVRWGDGKTAMGEQGKDVPAFTGSDVQWNWHNTVYGFQDRNVLLPIPLKELELNPNMQQNTGW